jgi:hypothetical protein
MNQSEVQRAHDMHTSLALVPRSSLSAVRDAGAKAHRRWHVPVAATVGALAAPELQRCVVFRAARSKHARSIMAMALCAMRPIARGRWRAVSAGGRLQQPQAGGPISRRFLETL